MRNVLLLVAVLTTSCRLDSSSPPVGEPPPLPTVKLAGSRLRVVAVNERVTLEATLTDAEGKPVDPYSVEWVKPGSATCLSPPGAWTEEHPEPGRYSLSFATHAPDRLGLTCGVLLRVKQCAGRPGEPEVNCEQAEHGPVVLVFPHAPPLSVHPLRKAETLKVGETRSVGALGLGLPMPDAAGPAALPADRPIIVTSSNPAIVEVLDPAGRVRAVAPGTATLDFHCGDANAVSEVVVEPGVPGPMATGVQASLVLDLPEILTQSSAPLVDDRFALGPAGPVALLRVGQKVGRNLFDVLLLAQWTGSGFGLESVGPPWETHTGGRVAVDETGRIWVLVFEERRGRHVLYHRPAEGGPSDWKELVLPRRFDLSRPEAEEPLRTLDHFGRMDEHTALVPAPGGGVWALWERWEDRDDCSWVVRLAQVSAEGLGRVEDVDAGTLDTWLGAGMSCEAYARKNLKLASQLELVLAKDKSAWPTLLRTSPRAASGASVWVQVLQRGEGSWAATRVEPGWGTTTGGITTDPMDTATEVASVRPQGAGEWLFHGGSKAGPFSEEHCVSVFPDPLTRPQACATWITEGGPTGFFGARAGSTLYVGASYGVPLLRLDARGAWAIDDVSPWFGTGAETFESLSGRRVYGVAASADRLYLAHGIGGGTLSGSDLRVVAVPTPQSARADSPEAEGLRPWTQPQSPVIKQAPFVTDEGVRFVAFDRRPQVLEVAGLLRSDGPGKPWREVMGTATATGPVMVPSGICSAGGALFGLVNGIDWSRSDDGGASWTRVLSLPGYPPSLARLAGGVAFTTVKDRVLQVWHLPQVDGSVPPVALGEGVTLSAGLGTDLTGRIHPLVPGTGEVLVLTDVDERPNPMRARRLALDGTVLDDIRFPKTLANLNEVPLFGGVTRGANGRLRMLRQDVSDNGYSAHVTDDLFRTLTRQAELGRWGAPVHSRTLRDGRWLVAGALRVGKDQWRAALQVSADDGRTWSAPRLLRPQGGFGQQVVGLAEEPDGGILAVVADNESFRAFVEDLQGQYSPRGARFDYVLVRVEKPE